MHIACHWRFVAALVCSLLVPESGSIFVRKHVSKTFFIFFHDIAHFDVVIRRYFFLWISLVAFHFAGSTVHDILADLGLLGNWTSQNPNLGSTTQAPKIPNKRVYEPSKHLKKLRSADAPNGLWTQILCALVFSSLPSLGCYVGAICCSRLQGFKAGMHAMALRISCAFSVLAAMCGPLNSATWRLWGGSDFMG